MEVTGLRCMAVRLADYVEKRTRIPFCHKDVTERLSAEEIYFYYMKIFGGDIMDAEKRKKLHELLDYCLDNGISFNYFASTRTVEFVKWNKFGEIKEMRGFWLDASHRDEKLDELIKWVKNEVINDDKS